MLSIIKPKQTNAKIYPEVNIIDYIMNFDGCSKGNPGIGGAGAVIYHNNTEYWNGNIFVGPNVTNNQSEYAGLILGLQSAIDLNIKKLRVFGDSSLVINHMKGIYKCKSSNLIELFIRAKELEKNFDLIEYNHVPRELNSRADELSNIAIVNYKL